MKLVIILSILAFVLLEFSNSSDQKGKKKSLVDYTDAEIERIYDEWEENDDVKIPDDEKPDYMKEPPKINLEDFKGKGKDEIQKLSKKGKSIMVFVTVSGKPARHEAEEITGLWQTSLFNAHYDVQRYMIEDNRAIFMLKDGSFAWEIKDFLVKQDRCYEVSIDNEIFDGNGKKNNKSDL